MTGTVGPSEDNSIDGKSVSVGGQPNSNAQSEATVLFIHEGRGGTQTQDAAGVPLRGMSTGLKVVIGIAIAFGATFLLLIAAAIAVPIMLGKSDRAERASGEGNPSDKTNAAVAGTQSCQDFLNGFLGTAKNNTGREDSARKLEAIRSRIADPYIQEQMSAMITNVRNNVADDVPGVNTVNYCLENNYLTRAQVQDWLGQMDRIG